MPRVFLLCSRLVACVAASVLLIGMLSVPPAAFADDPIPVFGEAPCPCSQRYNGRAVRPQDNCGQTNSYCNNVVNGCTCANCKCKNGGVLNNSPCVCI